MTRILLFCNAGMSTSMLVSKMRKEAASKGIDATINAYPEGQMAKYIGEADVVLLGPQIRYVLPKAKILCDKNSVPIEMINTADYGMMNGAKVLEQALKLASK
ncbi:PTS system, cellobiose-specific IIB component [Clostridium acidisoli DSM 12555]|jgi:PTS system cellobiose-specific IIB component|uniref:PTS system, cellobiose-specific IIB component n=1 Tax=Clostridium acidisoli DSM 12555 TaxID=1121291 RepID=A0A1W1XUB4_9CLOT|nr:PTS sugar transporter subunit IIB [Clostridium acidisoli]SMC27570.1 PTS system, cellobiose-specific IIB component [Clostridium acidisoli DSM 12555]